MENPPKILQRFFDFFSFNSFCTTDFYCFHHFHNTEGIWILNLSQPQGNEPASLAFILVQLVQVIQKTGEFNILEVDHLVHKLNDSVLVDQSLLGAHIDRVCLIPPHKNLKVNNLSFYIQWWNLNDLRSMKCMYNSWSKRLIWESSKIVSTVWIQIPD